MKYLIAPVRIIFVLSLFWLLQCCQIAMAESGPVGLDAIVAVINDGAITSSQLNDQLRLAIRQLEATHTPIPPRDVLRKKVLDHMIDNELQLQAAKKTGIEVDDAAVDKAIAHIAEQNHVSIGVLQKKLQEEGMNYKQYRKEIHNALVLNEIQQRGIAPRVFVSDQEVTDFLAIHGKELAAAQRQQAVATPGIYHVQIIIVPLPEAATKEQIATTKQEAQKVFAQLNANTNFEQFVTTKIGTDLNLQQQDLGWRKLEQLPDLYIKPVQNMQPGTLMAPIRAPNGFHIIKLAESRGGSVPTAIASPNMVETHVRHILIKSNPLQVDAQMKARLERLRASILAGTPFEQVAAANSQDPGSVGKGGDVGWVTAGALDPAFEAVMNHMKVGQVSMPFKSQFGWHILQVMDRKTRHDPEGLRRNQAKQIVFQQKMNAELQRWLQAQRNTGYVKVLIQ